MICSFHRWKPRPRPSYQYRAPWTRGEQGVGPGARGAAGPAEPAARTIAASREVIGLGRRIERTPSAGARPSGSGRRGRRPGRRVLFAAARDPWCHIRQMFMRARTYASVRVSRWLVLLPVYSPASGCAGCQLRYCPGGLANLIHGRVLGSASAGAYSEGITGLARVSLGPCSGLSRLRAGQG